MPESSSQIAKKLILKASQNRSESLHAPGKSRSHQSGPKACSHPDSKNRRTHPELFLCHSTTMVSHFRLELARLEVSIHNPRSFRATVFDFLLDLPPPPPNYVSFAWAKLCDVRIHLNPQHNSCLNSHSRSSKSRLREACQYQQFPLILGPNQARYG